KAIQAGGITLGHTYHAKDYGPMLRNAGFTAIGTYEMPREGDVAVPAKINPDEIFFFFEFLMADSCDFPYSSTTLIKCFEKLSA
ncbi:hypothetical protein MJN54_35925, partial [Salmonella enterica subsp. enterica serovar Kentucky]|nr:hypothetical protein [Salmonella enterica subsp. enterica serovar Kentucky]